MRNEIKKHEEQLKICEDAVIAAFFLWLVLSVWATTQDSIYKTFTTIFVSTAIILYSVFCYTQDRPLKGVVVQMLAFAFTFLSVMFM